MHGVNNICVAETRMLVVKHREWPIQGVAYTVKHSHEFVSTCIRSGQRREWSNTNGQQKE